MFDLSDKIILILGGRGYLGRSFCKLLSKQNAIVISADLPEESNAVSSSKFKEDYTNTVQFDVDVTKKSSVVK